MGVGKMFPSPGELLVVAFALLLLGAALGLGVASCVQRFGRPSLWIGWVR